MSQADQEALILRDAAVHVAHTKGNEVSPEHWHYADDRLRIELDGDNPSTLTIWRNAEVETKVFLMIWQGDGESICKTSGASRRENASLCPARRLE